MKMPLKNIQFRPFIESESPKRKPEHLYLKNKQTKETNKKPKKTFLEVMILNQILEPFL